MTTHRVPKDITGPYASRVDGVWANHTTPTGAWVRAWPVRGDSGTLVIERSDDGWTPVRQPARRPGQVSGPSGTSKLPRLELRIAEDEFDLLREAAATAGQPVATWVREVAVAAARKLAR